MSEKFHKGVFLGIGRVRFSGKGISYKKRFFEWSEVDEIEIMRTGLIFKFIYITRKRLSYGHKMFATMRNNPDVIILFPVTKKRLSEIKKYYQKEIIRGRNFKNTQD